MSNSNKENNNILPGYSTIDTPANYQYEIVNQQKDESRIWIRIAGISGCIAIIMAAYGAHS